MIPPHGGQLRQIAAHYGIPAASILDFSANINPQGPPASVLAALHKALEDPTTLASYPDLELLTLKQSIATHLAIDVGSISIANGFVPLLEAAIRTQGIHRCLLPVPAFTEYRRTLEICGVTVIPHPIQPCNFAYDPGALHAAIENARADAILLTNPQNPTGHLTPASQLNSILENTSATVLLDEAFIDYAPEESLTTLAATHQNLIIFRSVTKFFAMPGLRVAYSVSHPDTTKRIHDILPPWPVSTLANVAVQMALSDIPYQRQARINNSQQRKTLVAALSQLGIHPHPAAANFLLLPLPFNAQTIWQKLLMEHQILLRDCNNFEALTGNYLRTAVRNDSENMKLIAALAHILNPQSHP